MLLALITTSREMDRQQRIRTPEMILSYVSRTHVVERKNQQPKLPFVLPVLSHSRIPQANTQ